MKRKNNVNVLGSYAGITLQTNQGFRIRFIILLFIKKMRITSRDRFLCIFNDCSAGLETSDGARIRRKGSVKIRRNLSRQQTDQVRHFDFNFTFTFFLGTKIH